MVNHLSDKIDLYLLLQTLWFAPVAARRWITSLRTCLNNSIKKVRGYVWNWKPLGHFKHRWFHIIFLRYYFLHSHRVAGVYPGKKNASVPGGGELFLQVLEQHPGILQQILSTVLNVIMFEDCRNQWSMSRPLLGLILLNEEVRERIRAFKVGDLSFNLRKENPL